MKKYSKKILSIILAVILAFGVLPMAGFSGDTVDTTPYEREFVKGGTGWTFYSNGELVITKDYVPVYPSPWFGYARDVLGVSIQEGVTEIGTGEFEGCCSLRTVYIPSTVATIGKDAFLGCASLTLGTPSATVFFGGNRFENWDDLKFYFPEGIVTTHKHAHLTETRNINVYACSSKGTKGDTYCSICNTLIKIGDPVAKEAHNPETIWTVTKEATCGEEGEMVKLCKVCGEVVESKSIPATGEHDFSVFVRRSEADGLCEIAGPSVFKCSRCEATEIHDDEVGRMPHNYVLKSNPKITYEEWANNPESCAQGGIGDFICTKCSKEYSEKKDHVCQNGEYVIDYDSDCQKEGRQVQICDNCGEKFNSKTIAKKEHNYVLDYPNCMEGEDRTVYEICSYCKDKKEHIDPNTNEVEKWEDPITNKPFKQHQDPDHERVVYGKECTDNAEKQTYCAKCEFIQSRTQINAEYKNHKYINANTKDEIDALSAEDAEYVEIIEQPTCQETGTATYRCINHTLEGLDIICTHTETRSIPTVDCVMITCDDECVAPTCTRGGYNQKYCQWCGKGEREYLPISGGSHVTVTEEATHPTCTENGYSEGVYCSECGKVTTARSNKGDYAALGHDWDKDHYSSDDSSIHFHECVRVLYNGKVCGAHSKLESYDKKETCTADGYEGSAKCPLCSFEVQPTVLVKTGHDFTGEWKTSATEHWKECKNDCGLTSGKEAHDKNKILPAVPATCTKTGLTEGRACSVCGYVTVPQTETAIIPHEYTTTWSNDGTYHWHYCKNCGFIPEKYNHNDYAIEIGALAATCTSTGHTAGTICSVCGKYLTVKETDKIKHDFVVKGDENGHRGVCSACGGATAYSAHNFGDPIVTKAAKPFQSGEKTTKCADCGYAVKEAYSLNFLEIIQWIIDWFLSGILNIFSFFGM